MACATAELETVVKKGDHLKVKLLVRTLPARSGWLPLIPVSMTATVTPSPWLNC